MPNLYQAVVCCWFGFFWGGGCIWVTKPKALKLPKAFYHWATLPCGQLLALYLQEKGSSLAHLTTTKMIAYLIIDPCLGKNHHDLLINCWNSLGCIWGELFIYWEQINQCGIETTKLSLNAYSIWVWWIKIVIPAFWKLKQEDHEFKPSLCFVSLMLPYLRKQNKGLEIWLSG